MPEEVCPLHLTANQCRERARLVRNFAKGVSSALLRQDLLDIAGEYERRAEVFQIGEGFPPVTTPGLIEAA